MTLKPAHPPLKRTATLERQKAHRILSDSLDTSAKVPEETTRNSRSATGQECTPNLRSKLLRGYLEDPWFENIGHLTGKDKIELKNGSYWHGNALVIPDWDNLRETILQETHDSQYSGHLGIDRTIDLTTRDFWWPKIADDIRQYVKTCPLCQSNKADNTRKKGPLQPLPILDNY